ncbi:MAG: branched-chain amino acid aminotransferase [Balneolaceae bacterium]
MKIKRTLAEKSRISEVDFEQLEFGRIFSDHMFEMVWSDGKWQDPAIKPYGPISFTPALNVFHYGQSIFEGMKGYYVDENTLHLFRPADHHARMNRSSERMCIPKTDYPLFLEAIEELLKLDGGWVPRKHGQALYIRPHVFAAEEYLAARSSSIFRFYIITSPVGNYYREGGNPVALTTTDKFVRAVPGGTGEAKASGNYAASFYPAQQAQSEGYTQVLWLDAKEHRFIEEVGTMNIFFLIDGTLVTPALSGSVLNGITRRSVLQLAQSWGMEVLERRIPIDEVMSAGKDGSLQEAFGSGTAAVISPVGRIHHKGETLTISGNRPGPFSEKMYRAITGIQYGKADDPFGWTHKVDLS